MKTALVSPQELFTSSCEDAPSVEFTGELSWREFPALAKRVKEYLATERLAPSQGRRAFSSFVEMTYNVLHHGVPAAPRPGDPGRRVPVRVALGVRDGLVWIVTANLVSAGEGSELESHLLAAAGLGADRVRAAYRDVIVRAGERAGSGPGHKGGLGLLTLARDAAQPLEFEIVPSAVLETALFRLKVTI
jgi:hypothetical protein